MNTFKEYLPPNSLTPFSEKLIKATEYKNKKGFNSHAH